MLKSFLGTPRTEFGDLSPPSQSLLFSSCVTVIAHLGVSPPSSATQGEYTQALFVVGRAKWNGHEDVLQIFKEL